MYVLDTNAILYYVKGEPAVVSLIEDIFSKRTAVYISTVTEIELFAFPGITADEQERLEDFIGIISNVSLDSQIAKIAALYRRDYHLTIADSAIAATAYFTGSTLVTRNIKDFRKVPGLPLQKI